MAREVIKKGTDIRTIRKPINDAFAALPTHIRAEGAASTTSGNTMSFSVVGPDIIFIRLDSKTGSSPIKYAWTMMVHDRDTGVWTASPRAGLTTDDSFAVELNNASLATGTSKRYPARVNPHTGRVTFDQGGTGGGIAEIKSGDTRLMILGTYDEYKDCPGVPPKPPTTWADSCGATRTTTLCVPAYAYAVYQRCGYIWQKVGDTRDFGVWANETNGGSTSAWGRFHTPCWGGDRDPVTWLPDPEADCIGVTFDANSASAISCSCPAWFTGIECLMITVKWIAEPGSKPDGCPQDCWDLMASRWGVEETTTILYDEMGCVLQGDIGPFPINLLWTQYDWGADCFWGPDEFDPCDPCTGFGKLALSINSGSAACGNPANVWMSWTLRAKQLRDLLCDCSTGPIQISTGSPAVGPCGQLAEWVEISCCPGDMIMGGTPGSLPTDFISGGTPGSLPTDFIDGNF